MSRTPSIEFILPLGRSGRVYIMATAAPPQQRDSSGHRGLATISPSLSHQSSPSLRRSRRPGRGARVCAAGFPTSSTKARGASLLDHNVGLGCCGWWLPAINRRGVENRTHTHTHTPHTSSSLAFLAQSLGLVEFRRSPGVIESPELLESLVWVHL